MKATDHNAVATASATASVTAPGIAPKGAPKTRRGFLLGAGAAAGAGAAVALTAGQHISEPKLSQKPDTKGKGGGYHVTEHVKHYYRTTLV